MHFQGINWHYSTLAWIIPFSVSARKVCVPAQLPQLCLTLCDPMGGSWLGSLSMGFSRQEYWSGLPCSLQGRSSCVQFYQYLLVWWSLYILFFYYSFLFWRIFSNILLWQFSISALGIYHPTFSWPTRFLLRNILRSKWRLLSKFQVRK